VKAAVAAVALAAAACGRSAPAAPPPRVTDPGGAEAPAVPPEGKDVMRQSDATGDDVAVAATVMTRTPRKPPLVDVALDLRLDNRAAAPRWVLIPDGIGPPRAGGVDALEIRTWTGARGTATIGTLLGRAGALVLRLAPGAHLRWRGAVVGSWQEGELGAIDVIVADGATVAGKPLEAWFTDGVPPVAGEVDVAEAAMSGVVRFDPGYAEQPLALSGSRTKRVELK
jgi:hypothetical protein